MNRVLYETIINKQHHRYRRSLDWNPAEEYAANRLSPIQRMSDRFERLCREETPVILDGEQICFLRTITNLPSIFTDREW